MRVLTKECHMGFGEAGESTPHQRGDWASPFDNGENNRKRMEADQIKRKAEAAKALERRRPNNGNDKKRFLGSLALDGVSVNQNSRFE